MEEVKEQVEPALDSLASQEVIISSFEGLYKNWGKNDSQEQRRKDLLEKQKSNRNTKLDTSRGILDLVNAVEENDIFHSNNKAYYRPKIYVAGFIRASPSYKNVLMMSEWMIEKPSDLAENWYITPCPKATRVLVVANGGRTKCYTKYGAFKLETHTELPGGNRNDSNKKNSRCVLDCFYEQKNNTLYVLDFLAWNNQPMTDCDTEFRHYWLQSQFSERPGLGVVSKTNKTRFVLLPKVPCTSDELSKFMMTYPHFKDNLPDLDGLLFYHKQAHYVSGETPLVGWLYPYMVQEVLGPEITVHEKYLLQKPEGYVNQAEFIQIFEAKNAKKNRRRCSSRNSSAMDTADVDKDEMEHEEISDIKSVDSKNIKPTTMEAEESTVVVKDSEDVIEDNEKLDIDCESAAKT